MRISDWSLDVCSSDLAPAGQFYSLLPLDYHTVAPGFRGDKVPITRVFLTPTADSIMGNLDFLRDLTGDRTEVPPFDRVFFGNEKGYAGYVQGRSEERSGGKECVIACRSLWSAYH